MRDDLADVELADRVFAPHYAKAMPCRLTAAATVHVKPDVDMEQVDALEPGDPVELFDVSAGWGWVRTARAIGYVRADYIAPA